MAQDAQAAFDQLRARPVCAVITGIEMPRLMDRLALAATISKTWPDIPALPNSGHVVPAPGELLIGMAFIEKPYGPRTLLQHLRELLAKKE